MDKKAKIFIAGHRGLVGSALRRLLAQEGYNNIELRTRGELDLRKQADVDEFFAAQNFRYVIVAAAKVGGIVAHSKYPADFLYENLMITSNIIHAAAKTDVEKLLFIGSSAIYPQYAGQPIKEDYLLTGTLEPTSEGYALAKIAGVKLCQLYSVQYGKRFISAIPTNLYGPGDNFHPENSHVIAGMLRKFHNARVSGSSAVTLWGTGSPRREFLHADDLARAIMCLMESYEDLEPINIGTGSDITIREVASMAREVVGYKGEIVFDSSKPDGSPRKLLDSRKMKALGWRPTVEFRRGLQETYEWGLAANVFSSPVRSR